VDIYPTGIILCFILIATSGQTEEDVFEEFRKYMQGRFDSGGRDLDFEFGGVTRHFDPKEFIEKFMGGVIDSDSEKSNKAVTRGKVNGVQKQSLLELASQMTQDTPSLRPTAKDVRDKLIEICPELLSDSAKIPYWTYMDEVARKKFEHYFSPDESFYNISLPRLQPLTHLTLVNVKISTKKLFSGIL